MNRDDTIRIAKEAGFNQILATTTGADVWIDDGFYVEELERFAALVAAAEREKVVAWMHSNSYATGHGDTIEDLLKELEWQVAEREREACVELCLEHSKLNVDDANVEFSHLASYEFGKQVGAATCATAIRARGEV